MGKILISLLGVATWAAGLIYTFLPVWQADSLGRFVVTAMILPVAILSLYPAYRGMRLLLGDAPRPPRSLIVVDRGLRALPGFAVLSIPVYAVLHVSEPYIRLTHYWATQWLGPLAVLITLILLLLGGIVGIGIGYGLTYLGAHLLGRPKPVIFKRIRIMLDG